jgi:hypothetical protein
VRLQRMKFSALCNRCLDLNRSPDLQCGRNQ